MRLVLFRHGAAEEAAQGGDAARALTAEGRKKAQGMAHLLAAMDLGITHVVHSPLTRAAQTARVLLGQLPGKPEHLESAFLIPEAEPPQVAQAVPRKVECVALAGHEPSLSRFAAWCVGGGHLDLKKGGVVVLDGEDLPGAGKGVITWVLGPKILRHLR